MVATLTKLTTPRLTKYIPRYPTNRQIVFLLRNHINEVLYGGAAGGGKSDALLMGALQYADVAGYRALILRRTFADLALPGAIMDRSKEWLYNTDAHWSGQDKTWTFPSGASLTFGYLENEKDKFRYQSAEFQFIGFDELTQFDEHQYLYLFSRLRRLKGQAYRYGCGVLPTLGGVVTCGLNIALLIPLILANGSLYLQNYQIIPI